VPPARPRRHRGREGTVVQTVELRGRSRELAALDVKIREMHGRGPLDATVPSRPRVADRLLEEGFRLVVAGERGERERIVVEARRSDGIGTVDPGSATWTLKQKAFAGVPDAGTFKFGTKNLLPVVGDWNGDGKDGIGTFDSKSARWSLRQIATAGPADVGTFLFGKANTLPIVGDFTNPDTTSRSCACAWLSKRDQRASSARANAGRS